MINYKIKQYIKIAVTLIIISVLLFLILLVIFKYEIEGEKKENLPFVIEQISLVSTADGLKNQENTEYLWSGKLIQVNDIYIKVSKNPNISGVIENAIIQNVEIITPQKGNINLTKIIKNEDTSNNYVIEDLKEYKFTGGKSTSLENLTIANQGGIIGLRAINVNLGTYNSNDEEINYDGRILNIENITNDEIKFKLKFDILIELRDGIKYKTNIELELPVGNILENGVEIREYNNIDNLIYKRY